MFPLFDCLHFLNSILTLSFLRWRFVKAESFEDKTAFQQEPGWFFRYLSKVFPWKLWLTNDNLSLFKIKNKLKGLIKGFGLKC